MAIDQTIQAVWMPEPRREGEYPSGSRVGSDGITRIEYREQNMGTYGIGWFDVYRGDIAVESFNAAAVAEVMYFKPEQAEERAA